MDPVKCPINSYEFYFITMIITMTLYIVVSKVQPLNNIKKIVSVTIDTDKVEITGIDKQEKQYKFTFSLNERFFQVDQKGGKKNGGWKFLSPPSILKCFLRLKLQNFAVKSNSENRFKFSQKNSEYTVKIKEKWQKWQKSFIFSIFYSQKSCL